MTGRPLRVLYIDDDEGLRRLVGRGMERLGVEVVAAHNPAEGEACLSAKDARFDAVCVDHYMPTETGLDFLARLQGRPDLPPIIYVTGSDEGRLAVAALRAGATDYVIKETTGEFVALLHAAISAAVERTTLRAERERAIEDLRESRDRAERLAEERRLLMQEVNHRVANSLQLIAALTQLQESRIAQPDARAALAEVRHRVFAVAQVHQRLYTSEDVRSVALDAYVGSLVDELRRSVEGDGTGVTIESALAPVSVPPDHAVPIGVVLAELVTNAIKYAYPTGSGGIIRVRLERETTSARLCVEDDGVGMAAAAAASPAGTGLGSKIIAAMTSRLHGTLTQQARNPGTEVCLNFPLQAAA